MSGDGRQKEGSWDFTSWLPMSSFQSSSFSLSHLIHSGFLPFKLGGGIGLSFPFERFPSLFSVRDLKLKTSCGNFIDSENESLKKLLPPSLSLLHTHILSLSYTHILTLSFSLSELFRGFLHSHHLRPFLTVVLSLCPTSRLPSSVTCLAVVSSDSGQTPAASSSGESSCSSPCWQFLLCLLLSILVRGYFEAFVN